MGPSSTVDGGQKQHGLDIVERDRTGSRSLHKVKRYEELTGREIRKAVEEYAGLPRSIGYEGDRRKFDPRRFVLVTSAELDRDTGNVDTLVKLQDEYGGELEIEIWGAEALSRKLRDALAGRLLHARGLVTSRAAYAFALRGDVDRADNLWRQSILVSQFGSPARTASMARRVVPCVHRGFSPQTAPVRDDWPGSRHERAANRRRLLAGAQGPALAALEAAHNDNLPDAFGDTRHDLWEGRLAGHLREDLFALSLFGDVLAAGRTQPRPSSPPSPPAMRRRLSNSPQRCPSPLTSAC